jgi:chemotaxis protein methyltransferase CheR
MISKEGYEQFGAFLENACGIVLGADKQYLVTSRLTPLLRELGVTDLGALVERLRDGREAGLRDRILDAMTTNETLWFRDSYPFELLKNVALPEFAKTKPASLRFWSAACSSGQEPYSIAMTIEEFLMANPGSLHPNLQIIATDLSPTVLAQARTGQYEESAMVRGLSEERRRRFFKHKGHRWEVNPELRRRIAFQELNLLESYDALGKFNMIFCRNVLIYFSPERKRDILARMSRALQPGGYLLLGASESITGYSDEFEMLRTPHGILYRLRSKRYPPGK